MQPPASHPRALISSMPEEDRNMCLKTARGWYDILKSEKYEYTPEIAAESMRDCMHLTGVSLKELLGKDSGDKTDETLEKELKESIRVINIKNAKRYFKITLQPDTPYPEVKAQQMRDCMKNAGIKTVKELLGSAEDNAVLEARIAAAIKPHARRINTNEACRLYHEMVSTRESIPDLKEQIRKIDEHLKRAQEADPLKRMPMIDDSDHPLSNKELLEPYRSANGNLALGHARRLYAELKNGKVSEEAIPQRLDDIDAYLRLSLVEDKDLEFGLDPEGKKSDDDMIREALKPYKKKPEAKPMPTVPKPDERDRQSVTIPSELAKKLALDAMKDLSRLGIPRLAIDKENKSKSLG